MKYTVIGHYDEDGQVFFETVHAVDAYEAMKLVASIQHEQMNDSLCIVGAIEGWHKIVTPGEDNGRSAFVQDLAEVA